MRSVSKNIFTYHIRMFMILVLVFAAGCKKAYTPKAISLAGSYLVVEGFINAGNDSTTIRLTRTVALSQNATTKPEAGAKLFVEADSEVSIPLNELGNGAYGVAALNLDKTKLYHLRIRTTDGEEYASEPEEVKVTPPIDTVRHPLVNKNLDIALDTHDPGNHTHYYRWDYTEDWRFQTLYQSYYKVGKYINDRKILKDTVLKRTPDEQVYSCFGHHQSSVILLGSTAALSADVIVNNPILSIDASTEKLSIRYSILIKQYALTQKAYAFWQELKKNTEQLGSIYDALPLQSLGNLRNLQHPQIPVLGYVSISTVTSKRIYVDKTELLSVLSVYPYDCVEASAYYDDDGNHTNNVRVFLLSGTFDAVPLDALFIKKDSIGGYTWSSGSCSDCTTRGVIKQPAFWKNN